MTMLMQKFRSFRQFAAEAENGAAEGNKPEPTKAELAAAEREKINVNQGTDLQPNEDENAGEDNEETTNEEVEETKEEVEEHQKTEEELKAEKAAAKTQREKERVQKRIDKEVARRKAAEDKIKELEAKLAADPEKDKFLTEEEVEKRAKDKANQLALERQFVDDCNKLLKEATKVEPDFKKKIDGLAEEIAPIPGVMIGILTDLDNSGEVLAYFVNNEEGPEEYERIINMVANPAKMGIALTKLSNKIAEAKKPAPKPVSKVPNPPDVPGGNANIVNLDPSKAKTQEEYNRIRAQQIEQRRKERMAR